MKKFDIKSIPLVPVITGGLALVAVIAVVIIFVSSSGGAGLYITDVSGSVSITNADNTSVNGSSGDALAKGDIISVGDNSSCKITYKGKKNSDNNYIIAAPNTQIVINGDFDGGDESEIYLNRGALICNLSEEDKSDITVRTANSMVYPADTVSKIEYFTDGFEAYTDVHTFMGNSSILLYDNQGNPVNNKEVLIEKRSGRVTVNDLGPEFAYLNIEFPLEELTAFDLARLIEIAMYIDNFPYTTDELKAVYDSKNQTAEIVTESSTSLTTEIQNPEPIVTESTGTSPIVIEPPSTAVTTKPQTTTTTAATTTEPVTTTTEEELEDDDSDDALLMVVINIDGEETIQEVEYGGSAEKPSVPEIPGKRFIGWDKSFDNITEDTVITALFEDTEESKVYHNVTIVVADKSTVVKVEHGTAAPLPDTVNIEGYIFKGWDKDYTNITSDTIITAILESTQNTFTVTFMISGIPYTQTVMKNGAAIPPFTPTTDINGNEFVGWDKSYINITEDTVVTAIFGQAEYTVTFVVDGLSYPVKVKSGEDAIPPITPVIDSQGRTFVGWDGNYIAVTSDLTINAIFV